MGVESGASAFEHWAMTVDLPREGQAADAAAQRATAHEHIVAVDSIDLSFGGVKALSGVDLAVRKGDIHAIIGPTAPARARSST